MKSLLRNSGHENDNCMIAILEYFSIRKGEWVNKAHLSLLQFPYTEKGRRKHFSPETIGRKARLLAELGLLERKEVDHIAHYAWPEGISVPEKPKPYVYVPKRPVLRNGVTVWIPITETA